MLWVLEWKGKFYFEKIFKWPLAVNHFKCLFFKNVEHYNFSKTNKEADVLFIGASIIENMSYTEVSIIIDIIIFEI